MHLFQDIDQEIAAATKDKFNSHLWYLGGELITLALFSSKVITETKNKMRNRIQEIVTDRDESSLAFKITDDTNFINLNLENFVSSRSFFLFQLLEIAPNFLNQDALTWEFTSSYKIIKNVIEQSMITINDGAERMLGTAANIINGQRARKEKYFEILFI